MANCAMERNGKVTSFGIHGILKVTGTKITDQNGNPFQLRGLSSHNLNNYPEYINEEGITQMVDEWGINVFRLAMYSASADGFDGYSDGTDAHREELENLIMKGVQIAAKLGIYVIVDWHILFDYDPNMHTDMALHFFKKMCPILKEYDNVIYEICNEPNGDTTWAQICTYANQVIPVIRELDEAKMIVVGTPSWSQRVDEAAAAPLSYDNLLYTLHFYADTHKAPLRNIMEKAIHKGLPILISEFGICAADGAGAINREETALWLELCNQYGVGYILWSLSNKDETSAILKPDCQKVSGFTSDDLSAGGQFFLEIMKNNY